MDLEFRANTVAENLSKLTNSEYKVTKKESANGIPVVQWTISNGSNTFYLATDFSGDDESDIIFSKTNRTYIEESDYEDENTLNKLLEGFLRFASYAQ